MWNIMIEVTIRYAFVLNQNFLNPMLKKLITGISIALLSAACMKSSPVSTNITVKASATSSTGKTSSSGRVAATNVAITDFKINISKIKFELDEDDDRYNETPEFDDIKLNGPFLLDLLNPDQTLTQIIASVDLPSGTYEEIKFKFDKSTESGEMSGKTFLIKGTIDDKAFLIWSGEDAELEVDFENADQDVLAGGDGVIVNIKIKIDALLARITELAKAGALKDLDGDGVIEITTLDDDGHSSIGKQFKDLLEDECHLDDKD